MDNDMLCKKLIEVENANKRVMALTGRLHAMHVEIEIAKRVLSSQKKLTS